MSACHPQPSISRLSAFDPLRTLDLSDFAHHYCTVGNVAEQVRSVFRPVAHVAHVENVGTTASRQCKLAAHVAARKRASYARCPASVTVGPHDDLGNAITYDTPTYASPPNAQRKLRRRASERVVFTQRPEISATPRATTAVSTRHRLAGGPTD